MSAKMAKVLLWLKVWKNIEDILYHGELLGYKRPMLRLDLSKHEIFTVHIVIDLEKDNFTEMQVP